MADGNGFNEWGGYMEAKITKLEEQFSSSSSSFRQSKLFAGISIFVNGRTEPSADELKRIMMLHGGTFHHYERSHTNYIIATNLPDVKVRNMDTSKIIGPQWVVDCVREMRILDYSRYLLYTNQKTSQPRINFPVKTIVAKPEPPTELAKPTVGLSDETHNHVSTLNGELRAIRSAKRPLAEPERVGSDRHEMKPEFVERDLVTDSKTANTRVVARTAVDPNFLSEFYNNSRLHHIASLGAGFKQYVSELRQLNASNHFPARNKLLEAMTASGVVPVNASYGANKAIMHIDMDSFFVSVGLRRYPHLRGYPVAVTHSKGGAASISVPVHPDADRQAEMKLHTKNFEHNNILMDKVRNGFDANASLSEIASCSYEARAKGVHNGMFVGQAMKLCPELRMIPYDFEAYREVAYTLYDTIAQYTLDIEPVSCDEMFVDLHSVLSDLGISPNAFCCAVREQVRQRTGCPCSAGIGANKLQARMATKRAKPDGQYILPAADVEAYMADIPIQELPGVGSSIAFTLQQAQLHTSGDLQKIPLPRIQALVGKKIGETLYQFCRGQDARPLVFDKVRQSVSAEVNYGIRFNTELEVITFLQQLCAEVHKRLCDIKRRARRVTLKVMVRAKEAPAEAAKFMGHGACDHVTKSVSLSDFTTDLQVITRTILATMKSLALAPNNLRGIGIQLCKLDEAHLGRQRQENPIKSMFAKAVQRENEPKSERPFSPALEQREIPIQSATSRSVSHVTGQEYVVRASEEAFNVPSMSMSSTSFPAQHEHAKTHTQQDLEFAQLLPNASQNQEQALVISQDNVFAKVECIQELLAWVQSSVAPVKCDTEMIISFACEMVRARSVDTLYDPLLYLGRLINSRRDSIAHCEWHIVFRLVLHAVNVEIQRVYGARRLFVEDTVKCNKCQPTTKTP